MVRECLPQQWLLQNHSSQHLGGLATPWSAEEILDGQTEWTSLLIPELLTMTSDRKKKSFLSFFLFFFPLCMFIRKRIATFALLLQPMIFSPPLSLVSNRRRKKKEKKERREKKKQKTKIAAAVEIVVLLKVATVVKQ